jgi:hypothetical protein
MEPLPAATLAGLTPKDIPIRFHDDRMETIPFDEPTDLVAISESMGQTRIRSHRNIAGAACGGDGDSTPRFVRTSAAIKAVVCGEAEALWLRVIDDAAWAAGEVHRQTGPDFTGGIETGPRDLRERYLPIGLIGLAGCHFARVLVQTGSTPPRRAGQDDITSPRSLVTRRNCSSSSTTTSSNLEQAKNFSRAGAARDSLGQPGDINAAHDEDF